MTNENDPGDDGALATMYGAPFLERIARAPAAPRPLAISAEEHAVETFLRSMVAAGYTIEKYTETMTVEQAMERLHDCRLQQISLRKGHHYATLNAGRLF